MTARSLLVIFLTILVLGANNSLAKRHDVNKKNDWETRNKDLIVAHKFRVIERLVFTSGGAKGGVYPGVLKALEITGLLPHVEKVAGSSAGAIVAALLAVGIDLNVLYEDFRLTHFADLLGDDVGSWCGNRKGVTFFTKDGHNLLEHAQNLINKSITTFLSSNRWKEQAKNSAEIEFAEHFLQNRRFTFGDLNFLHQRFPDKFKDLTTISVEFNTGDVRVFNSRETPEIEIAKAVRASSSIPAIFEPYKIVYKNRKEQHVDGGLYELLPADYFDVGFDGTYIKNQKPERTLLFSFADNAEFQESSIFKALHSSRADEIELRKKYSRTTAPEDPRFFQPSWFEKIIRDGFVKYIGEFDAPYTHPARWDQTYYDVYSRYHHNTVPIGNGEIIAINFPAATTWSRELFAIGYIDTMAYIIAHELHEKSNFDAGRYYRQLFKVFQEIYQELLQQMNISLDEDSFALSLQALERKLVIQLHNNAPEVRAEQLCSFIRDSIRNDLGSPRAFALTLAVEKCNGFLSATGLKKDIVIRATEREHFISLGFHH